jgi:hypothetical protein
VLSEYDGGVWNSRSVFGPPVGEVVDWLARIEARPRLPGPVSGKPLAWLHLTTESSPGRMRALRSVGLLTDVLRALDRGLNATDLQDLASIFARAGQPFDGSVDQVAR